jgi:hypothetical protein
MAAWLLAFLLMWLTMWYATTRSCMVAVWRQRMRVRDVDQSQHTTHHLLVVRSSFSRSEVRTTYSTQHFAVVLLLLVLVLVLVLFDRLVDWLIDYFSERTGRFLSRYQW